MEISIFNQGSVNNFTRLSAFEGNSLNVIPVFFTYSSPFNYSHDI